MKKGSRQTRLCKFGCGRQVKENWSNGKFKGYHKTCGICNPKGWTDKSKEKLSKTISGENHPRSKKIMSRRKTVKRNKWYWEIKVSHGKKWMLEHRYIMEKKIGRKLKSN